MRQLYDSGLRGVWAVLEVEIPCVAGKGKVIADNLSYAEIR